MLNKSLLFIYALSVIWRPLYGISKLCGVYMQKKIDQTNPPEFSTQTILPTVVSTYTQMCLCLESTNKFSLGNCYDSCEHKKQ